MQKIDSQINPGLINRLAQTGEYFFGQSKLPKIVLQKDGRGWGHYLPQDVIQNANGFEPSSCTSYGTINAIETLFRRMGVEVSYSERALAISAYTLIPGYNDPHTVAETIRKVGLMDETLLPWEEAKTLEEYYSPKPLTKTLVENGKIWLKTYVFQHEWVFKTDDPIEIKRTKIKEALRYSPLGVSVFAWVKNLDGLYVKAPGVRDNHWCVLYDFDENNNWYIFDTYDYTHKILSKDYNFETAKAYYIGYNNTPKISIWSIIRKIFNI